MADWAGMAGSVIAAWVAGAVDLAGCYTVGNRRRFGFLLHLIANGTWIYVAIHARLYGLLLVVVPAMILNVRNYRKWRSADK